ncbi:hypothetical protein ILYODFUR_031554 [Ilyodon furcidens]|uniref:Uncharacterized protein n=1 Tax=Ilyodon furcidens TaxID=33524 RepID=A0ABV0UYN7_9TELE
MSSPEGSRHREGSGGCLLLIHTGSTQHGLLAGVFPGVGGRYSAPSAGPQSSVRPPVLVWVQARPEFVKMDLMKSRCYEFVLYLMDNPQALDLVHSVLQAEFLLEGWLDARAPVSTEGPFAPLVVAVRAAQSPKDPATNPPEPQHAAKPPDPACTERTTDAPALVFAGGQPSSTATVPEPLHAVKPQEFREGFEASGSCMF